MTPAAEAAWMRIALVCAVCRAPPRERIIADALHRLRPGWRQLRIHESSPGGWAFSAKLRREAPGYLPTQFDPALSPGARHPQAGWRNENLEAQTFADAMFDIVVTQDVFEHLFDPQAAMREIARTLVPGGLVLMTVPVVRGWDTIRRRAALRDGQVEHLEPPEYHGNPVGDGRSLVTVDWSYDIGAVLAEASGLSVTVMQIDDLGRGIRDPYNVLIVARKPVTVASAPLAMTSPTEPSLPAQGPPAMTQPLTFQPISPLAEEGCFTVGGLRFNGSVKDFTRRTSADEVVILKVAAMLDFYRTYLGGRAIRKILEFGTWEGGSPLYFTAATNLEKFVGIDLRGPSEPILQHAAQFGDRLKLIYQTSQSDRAAVTAAIDTHLDGRMDLVLDDASHHYGHTKAAFEIAFPRLRVGGLYIIEDWNWAHYPDRTYDDLWADQPALSNLILELVLALGSGGAIKSIEIKPWCAIIEKGASVPDDFRLDDAIRMGERRRYTQF